METHVILGFIAFCGWAAYLMQRSFGNSFQRIEDLTTIYTEAHWRAVRAGVRLPREEYENEIKGMGTEYFEQFIKEYKIQRGMEDVANSDWGKYMNMKLSKRYELVDAPLSDENLVNTYDSQVVKRPTDGRGESPHRRTPKKVWIQAFKRWARQAKEARNELSE